MFVKVCQRDASELPAKFLVPELARRWALQALEEETPDLCCPGIDRKEDLDDAAFPRHVDTMDDSDLVLPFEDAVHGVGSLVCFIDGIQVASESHPQAFEEFRAILHPRKLVQFLLIRAHLWVEVFEVFGWISERAAD